MSRLLILIDPLPRTLDAIMRPDIRRRLEALGEIVLSEDGPMPDAEVERLLPETAILIGQTAMGRERLARAPSLRAIFNVETNFLPNVDYLACQERGIWVLAPASAFAPLIAEAGLAMAIDFARGITAANRAFRAGREEYGLAGNRDTFPFAGAPVGLIGFGDLGRALRSLLVPFRNPVMVHDPWLPDMLIERHDCRPATLEALLRECRIVFVLASVTTENEGLLGARELALMPRGSALLLLSRAAIVDFPALLDAVSSGHLRAAIDVFPDEPAAADDPIRGIEGLLLDAHGPGPARNPRHAGIRGA